jgi:hypothetical protein
MSVNQTFIDGVGVIAGQGGNIRIELSQFLKLPVEGQEPELVVSERLIMNLDTFLKMHQTMAQVIGQMESKGIIKKANLPEMKPSSK